jgi:predicted nucleic acid-binding protein
VARASGQQDPDATRSSRPRVLFDTNVLLDIVLAREPWATDAVVLLDVAASGGIEGFVAAHAVTTIHYVVEREHDRPTALMAVADLLSVLQVAELGAADFQRALALELRDYEDAVQVAACLRVGAQFLVTRNAKDFRGAPVTARGAGEVLALLGVLPGGG